LYICSYTALGANPHVALLLPLLLYIVPHGIFVNFRDLLYFTIALLLLLLLLVLLLLLLVLLLLLLLVLLLLLLLHHPAGHLCQLQGPAVLQHYAASASAAAAVASCRASLSTSETCYTSTLRCCCCCCCILQGIFVNFRDLLYFTQVFGIALLLLLLHYQYAGHLCQLQGPAVLQRWQAALCSSTDRQRVQKRDQPARRPAARARVHTGVL
jgi:hypothetical protein